MTGGSVVPVAVGSARAAARRRLAAAGIEPAGLEARLLLAHVLGCDMAALLGHPERPLDAVQAARFEALIARRERHEPVAMLLGAREFWSLPMRVTRDTLVPRPETEALVAAALAWIGAVKAGDRRSEALRLLDLGSGTGCILLALLSELPAACGVGVDVSPGALAVARDNAGRLDLSDRAGFVRGDWATALAGRFDIIVSNPPYIRDADWPRLPADVRDFEPRVALAAGPDGLDAYRRIVPDLGRLLAATGAACVEIDDTTVAGVTAIARASGLQVLVIEPDLHNRPRCLVLRPGNFAMQKKELGNQSFPV